MSDFIELGDYTYGTPRLLTWDKSTKVKIGNFCSIANDVRFFLGGNHRLDWVTTYPFPAFFQEAKHIEGHVSSKGDIIVGNDVWLGNNAAILSGVNIGDGAVIGANCVVSKNVEPYSIVVGNPQRTVRKRFTDKQINQLLRIKWWFWDIEKIKANLHLLCSENIDEFIEKN